MVEITCACGTVYQTYVIGMTNYSESWENGTTPCPNCGERYSRKLKPAPMRKIDMREGA